LQVFISRLTATDRWMDVLGLGPREHVAIVGGGGKTTLCFELARGLSGAGKRVITTTTTHMWRQEADFAPCVIFWPQDPLADHRLKDRLRKEGHVFVADQPLSSGKVKGIAPERADTFFQDPDIDYVIVEADGAAGRPVKAPAAHEPVIPSSVTLVIAVMGLEAIGMPVSGDSVFRLELFAELTGLGAGEVLTPGAAVPLFQSPMGLFKGAPEGARKIVCLNKADRLMPDQDVNDLARRLLQSPGTLIQRVMIGSLRQGTFWAWIRGDSRLDANP